MFLCCVFALNSVYADCNTPVTISYEGNQEPNDDEFLYGDTKQYQLAKNGYENSGHKNSGAGRVYECDQFNSGGCTKDDLVSLEAGHVFKGETINVARQYRCATGLWGVFADDRWKVVDAGVCDTPQWGKINRGDCVRDSSGCKELTEEECSGYTRSDPNGTKFKGLCKKLEGDFGQRFICEAIECKGGGIAVDGICGSSPTPTTPTTPKTPKTPKKSCTGSNCASSVPGRFDFSAQSGGQIVKIIKII